MKENLVFDEKTEKSSLSQQFMRGDVFSDKCPSRDVLKHVTSRWAVLVLLALKSGETHRFSELRRAINGVSEKMLAQTLQVLEQDGFVLRVSYPVVPPHVEYSLTESGVQVAGHVVGLADWIEENISNILSNHSLPAESISV
jgi:DNA-binding HxlR family transcriptional regulator